MDEVGNRVKRERTMRGWSQRDLAERANVTAETISTVETGQHDPRPSTLRKLADAFSVEVRELFEEPATAGKGEASETGPTDPEGSTRDIARDAARRASEQDLMAARRAKASEGIPQIRFVHPFNEALPILSRRYPDELADALLEAERDIVDLKLELDQKDQEIAMLRERAHS